LDIGVLGYIGIVQHKEHSPEVLSIPPGTLCIYTYIHTHTCVCVCVCMYVCRGKHIADSGNVDPPTTQNGF